MKKKIIIVLFLILSLSLVTACGKGVKKGGKTVYTCTKNNVRETKDDPIYQYSQDIKYQAKIEDDGKLNYYLMQWIYTYDTKENCDYWCDVKVNWNDEINEKGYPGNHRETTCNCSKKQLTEKYIYDDIPSLAKITRTDIRELNSDNTFQLDTWIERYEKAGYNCG